MRWNWKICLESLYLSWKNRLVVVCNICQNVEEKDSANAPEILFLNGNFLKQLQIFLRWTPKLPLETRLFTAFLSDNMINYSKSEYNLNVYFRMSKKSK